MNTRPLDGSGIYVEIGRVRFADDLKTSVVTASVAIPEERLMNLKTDVERAMLGLEFIKAFEADMIDYQNHIDRMRANIGEPKHEWPYPQRSDRSALLKRPIISVHLFNRDQYISLIEDHKVFWPIANLQWITEESFSLLNQGVLSPAINDLIEKCDQPDAFKDYGLDDLTDYTQARLLVEAIKAWGF